MLQRRPAPDSCCCESHRCALHPVPMIVMRAPYTTSPAPTSSHMHAVPAHKDCAPLTLLRKACACAAAHVLFAPMLALMHAPCTHHAPYTYHARDAHPARMCHACSSTVHREETLMMPTPVASSASALLPGVDVENMSETLVIFCEQRSQAALAQVCLEHNRGAWRCVVRGARCSGVVYRPTPLTRPTRARPRARTCAFRR